MEKARYNTELYSNLRVPLNNVKPSNWQCPKFCVNDILSGRVIVEFYNPILFSNIAIN